MISKAYLCKTSKIPYDSLPHTVLSRKEPVHVRARSLLLQTVATCVQVTAVTVHTPVNYNSDQFLMFLYLTDLSDRQTRTTTLSTVLQWLTAYFHVKTLRLLYVPPTSRSSVPERSHRAYIYEFRMTLKINFAVPLNSKNRLIFVVGMRWVFFEVRTESLKSIQTYLGPKESIFNCRLRALVRRTILLTFFYT
jgi:hypothetical protein